MCVKYTIGGSALFFLIILLICPAVAFSQSASRVEAGQTIYYATLGEAFAAASGISLEAPDEITVLEDLILAAPILIDTTKHIRLVPGDGAPGGALGGDRTIWRGGANLEAPLFRITGEGASLTLGVPPAQERRHEHKLAIDGGYLRNPPILASAPLVVVNGLDAKLVMYDNVYIQNNYNSSNSPNTSLSQMGAGVYLRAIEDIQERQSEFIMKGGTIRGNVNNREKIPCGAGVYIAGFGLFTMEGGVIAGNTAHEHGGGFHTGSRGSFRKTGGIIYGDNAPDNLKNVALTSIGLPPSFGSAVMVPSPLQYDNRYRVRDTTVGEHENLTYTGAQIGQPVFFGENEVWGISVVSTEGIEPAETGSSPFLVILLTVSSVLLAVVIMLALLFIARKRKNAQSTAVIPGARKEAAIVDLTPQEHKIFEMLLDGKTPKEIAHELQITYNTVVSHQKNIYRKLGVQSITDLLVKFRPVADIPASSVPAVNKRNVTRHALMAAGVLAALAAVILLIIFNAPEKGYNIVIDHWYGLGDEKSTGLVTRRFETINGKKESRVTISGTFTQGNENFTGVYGRPNAAGLKDVRRMRAFSFTVLGDGNDYCVRLPTFETMDGDHWMHIFSTTAGEVITVNVNIPEGLIREGWSGKEAEFIKENIMFFLFQPAYYGNYHLQFWDLRLYNRTLLPAGSESQPLQSANNNPWLKLKY